jgi:DNA-binding MarR family transcriptional regulator
MSYTAEDARVKKAPSRLRPKILAYLAQVDSASPHDIMAATGFKKNSITSELSRMKEAGKVER